MKLVRAKRCLGVIGIVSVGMLILATVATSSMSYEQDADAREEKKRGFDQQQEDDGSQDLVMTICLMPLECS